MRFLTKKTGFIAALLCIVLGHTLNAQCPTCPIDVEAANENTRLVMIFAGDVDLSDTPVTVYEENGDLCGTFIPVRHEDHQDSDDVWKIEINLGLNCVFNTHFTGTLVFGTLECFMFDGEPQGCNDECEDCAVSIEFCDGNDGCELPYTGLYFNFAQEPSWINEYSYFYFIKGTTTLGPYTLQQPSGVPPNSWVSIQFPPNLMSNGEMNFVFGIGSAQCNYFDGTFTGCSSSNPNGCNCPLIEPFGESDGEYTVFLEFEGNPPNYPPSDPILISLNWGQNLFNGGVISVINGSTWVLRLPTDKPIPFGSNNLPPYTGELTINNEITCIYENSVPIACEESFFGDEDCEELANCEEELGNFVLNIPGSGCAKWKSACNTYEFLYRYGDVSIGTAGGTPNGYNLSVTDGIMTDHIKVELCGTGGWCDYVFEEGYDLKPLKEVETFVDENGYLPNTISEQDVIANNGVEVKGVMISQQEKIEELFLYLIEMNKKIKETEEVIGKLEMENKVLKTRAGF